MPSKKYAITTEAIAVLEERMAELGVSRSELGRRAGLSHVTIGRILDGEAGSTARLDAICEALEMPLFRVLPLDAFEKRWLEDLHLLRVSSSVDSTKLSEFIERVEHQIQAEIALAEAVKGKRTG